MTTACLFPGQGRSAQTSQLDIVQSSLASYKRWQEAGGKPGMVAGHSLGWFTALIAAGIVHEQAAMALVELRQFIMAQFTEGKMAAIIGMEEEPLAAICQQIAEGTVVIANHNSPKQLVISGDVAAVDQATALAKASGAKAIQLKVAGGFHTPLMAEPNRIFGRYLKIVHFSDPVLPFYSSVTGERVLNGATVKDMTVTQMEKPVLWRQTVEAMAKDGMTECWEADSSTVLGKLVAETIHR